MSTHDMYFSTTNKNYIFNILQDLVLTETSIDINNNKEYIDLYRFKYPLIFERSTSDNLIDINKELIDQIGLLIINDINKISNINKSKTIESKPIDNTIVKFTNELNLNSTNFIHKNLNRYNYYISVPKKTNEFKIKEIIIPIEDNILFSHSIIFLSINNINLKCDFVKKLNIGNLNLYRPIEDKIFKNTKKLIKF